jgi:hypothetical protein
MKISDFVNGSDVATGRMPVEVFEGGGGDLVFCQECPHVDGDRYLRTLVPMRDALKLAHAIIGIARKAEHESC